MMRDGVSPWRMPWISQGLNDPTLPQNADTKKTYRGINRLYLSVVSYQQGWSDPRFCTFNQAKKLGGTIRKGSKGTSIVFYSKREVTDKSGLVKDQWILRRSSVFNAAQTEGIEYAPIETRESDSTGTRVEAERVTTDWVERSGIQVVYGIDRAAYQPAADRVVMPLASAFTSEDAYFNTFFHELVHTTGHESRLARIDSTDFATDPYAKEELVAEIGAAMLCSTVGLDASLMEQSASYLKAWADRLEKDPGLIVKAANQAERAARLILGNDVETSDAAASSKNTPIITLDDARDDSTLTLV
jgi:antirestriction protein ArdC